MDGETEARLFSPDFSGSTQRRGAQRLLRRDLSRAGARRRLDPDLSVASA
jgi:hypothetical protein